ncbi:MAG: hypothetical protein QOJ29_3275 [Thermoleophilaceae bacterium]|nr:hypothetical protein [Thermoleophilaceae bacterium]
MPRFGLLPQLPGGLASAPPEATDRPLCPWSPATTTTLRRGPGGVAAQVLDHREPGGVELLRGRGRAAARDAVRLFDEGDGQTALLRGLLRGGQVRRAHPSPGPVAEDQRRGCAGGDFDVDPCWAIRRAT